jgi:Matrixin
VKSSTYGMNYGGTTTRCPSLFFECGASTLDGFNDVGWVAVDQPFVLAVASLVWHIESGEILEADVALNVAAGPWSLDGVGGADVQTVLLHEFGHVAGLDHVLDPAAVDVYPVNDGVVRTLSSSEIDGISWIYPIAAHPPPDHPVHPAPPITAEVVAELGRPAPGGGVYECSFEVIELADSGAASWRTSVKGVGTIRVIGALIGPESDEGFFVRGQARINERREVLFPAQLIDGRLLLFKVSL